jgi:hypothetical protein
LVFPQGEAFTPDSSVRINIVGHPETLEQVGATKLADYTDQLVQENRVAAFFPAMLLGKIKVFIF